MMSLLWRGALGFLCAVIVVAILFTVFAQSKGGGASPCLSRIKQIGVANLIYRSENNDICPPEEWIDATLPYTNGTSRFSCPDVHRWGYAMNLDVVSKKVKDDDAKTVVIFETDALARNVVANLAARATARGRFKSGSNVVFADSHARFIKAGVAP